MNRSQSQSKQGSLQKAQAQQPIERANDRVELNLIEREEAIEVARSRIEKRRAIERQWSLQARRATATVQLDTPEEQNRSLASDAKRRREMNNHHAKETNKQTNKQTTNSI